MGWFVSLACMSFVFASHMAAFNSNVKGECASLQRSHFFTLRLSFSICSVNKQAFKCEKSVPNKLVLIMTYYSNNLKVMKLFFF